MLRMKKICFLFMIVFVAHFCHAEDLVWIEAPDSVESRMPFELTLHIDDPNIQNYANIIYIRPKGGSVQYLADGYDIAQTFDSDYGGQKEINFTVWGDYSETYDNTINFTFDFFSDRKILADNFDPNEFVENNYKVGTVAKQIEVLPVKCTGSFPSYSDCKREEFFEPKGVARYSCRYDGEDDYPRVRSARRSVVRYPCVPDKYRIENDLVGCSYMERSELGKTTESGNTVTEIKSYSWGVPSAGKGSSEGYIRISRDYSEYRKHTPDDEEEETLYEVSFSVDFYQKAGWISYDGDVSKSMWIEKDEIDGEMDKLVTEAKDFVGSIACNAYGNIDPNKDYKSRYVSYFPGQTKTSDIFVYGYVTDIDKDPLPYMKTVVKVNNKEYEGYTDLNGNYEIELENLKDTVNGTIIFDLDYTRENTNYYRVYLFKPSSQEYKSGYFGKNIEISPDSHTELNFVLDGTPGQIDISNLGTNANIRDCAVIYFRMHEAVEFALERLHLKLDHKLPVEVLVGQNDQETLYSPDQSMIKIAKSDQSYLSSNNPRNREYHEFAHHVMFDIYGDWPKGAYERTSVNHDGFLNPNTADSYIEGFAEFMALANAKYLGYKDADEYAGFGSMEDNYKPWDDHGYNEEFAVASLLWDMHDTENEPGDTLTMNMDDIWRVLAVKRPDFYEYYKAFKQRYPEKSDDFDELFKLHGFFYDTREGNKKYDDDEPIRDKNNNDQHDSGEFFVDLSGNPKNITYQKGFEIGKAANYERKDRSQAVRLEDSFLKVDPKGPRFYRVTVSQSDREYSYVVERRQDKVYLHPRPSDHQAKITVEPDTKDFTFSKKFEITNAELKEKNIENRGQGYFQEHDFGLNSLGTNNDPEYAEDFEPVFTNDDRFYENIKENIEGEKRNSGFFRYIILFLGIGAIGVLAFSNRTANFRSSKKKYLVGLREQVSGFKGEASTKYIPVIKKKIKEFSHDIQNEYWPALKLMISKFVSNIEHKYWPKIQKWLEKSKSKFENQYLPRIKSLVDKLIQNIKNKIRKN